MSPNKSKLLSILKNPPGEWCSPRLIIQEPNKIVMAMRANFHQAAKTLVGSKYTTTEKNNSIGKNTKIFWYFPTHSPQYGLHKPKSRVLKKAYAIAEPNILKTKIAFFISIYL